MIPIPALWLPILLSAVVVFIASSVIHMFLTYHKNDFRQVPDEEGTMSALRALNIPPGDYVLPYAGSMEVMNSDEFKAKVEQGPVGVFTIFPPRAWASMGPQLAKWFVYCLVVASVAAYVAGRELSAGAEYLSVFRLVGTVAFACYAMSLPQRSIWYHQGWGSTLRSMFDGLLYAALTAGVFGWLWPA